MSRVLPLIPALRLVPKQRIIFKLGQRRPQNRTDRPPGLLGLKWGVFAVTGPREQGVAQNALHGAQQRPLRLGGIAPKSTRRRSWTGSEAATELPSDGIR